MKSAMWSVDPEEGTRYVAQTDAGQEVLFVPPARIDTGPLLDPLRTAFGTDWFTIEQAADVTLFQTPFHPSSHLKRMTLKPAEEAGTIEVDRPPGKRRGTAARSRARCAASTAASSDRTAGSGSPRSSERSPGRPSSNP
jgi:hypothetical protein